MDSELTRTIPFNKNPANVGLSVQSNTLAQTTAAANTAVAGTAKAAAGASSVGAFLTTKAGIVLISVVATVVVATAVVVPVVVTQTGEDEAEVTDLVTIQTTIPISTTPGGDVEKDTTVVNP